MLHFNFKTILCIGLVAAFSASAMQPAHAGRWNARGQSGAAGTFHQKGQYGQRAGARAVKFGQGGLSAKGGNWAGPNGGTLKRGGVNAWKNGQGAFHASGSQGTGPNGGAYQRGGVTAVGQNGGFHNSAFNGTAANGSTLASHNKWQAEKGVGFNKDAGFNYAGANGSSATGYKTNNFDATTGTGTATKGRDYNTASGQSYGYDATTSYTKGQGFSTTIDSQNKQDYTIDYTKGSKPVVTPITE